MQKTAKTNGCRVRDAELPKNTMSGCMFVKTECSAKRCGDDLGEFVVVTFGRTPEAEGITHLWDKDVFDEGCSDERGRWRIAKVDARDEVSSELSLGDYGIEVLIPSTVALDDEAEVFVGRDKFEVVIIEGERNRRFLGFDTIVKKKKL